jgi:hypothetical protein
MQITVGKEGKEAESAEMRTAKAQKLSEQNPDGKNSLQKMEKEKRVAY